MLCSRRCLVLSDLDSPYWIRLIALEFDGFDHISLTGRTRTFYSILHFDGPNLQLQKLSINPPRWCVSQVIKNITNDAKDWHAADIARVASGNFLEMYDFMVFVIMRPHRSRIFPAGSEFLL